MAASYLTMRGQKWMIGQHDNRLYHRPRWERTERSETTSASRIEYPNRCDWRCSHDRERCISEFETIPLDAVTWKYLFGRCGTKAAIRHITHKL
jgi:hypothetical protein